MPTPLGPTRLFGQHGLHISSSVHLTGKHNHHLRDCVVLFMDEAFFAGDKAHVGILKALITEPVLTVEKKYNDAVQARNYLHIIMASNSDWVVPAEIGEERYFCLDVSSERRGDHPYFKAIQDELDNGGYQAMLDELLNRDISKFEVRDVPQTRALQDQQKQSLDTKTAWWLDVLSRGYVYKSKLGLEEHFSEWHEFVTTEVLYASYSEFAEKRKAAIR